MRLLSRLPLRSKFLVAPLIGLLLMLGLALIFLNAIFEQEVLFEHLNGEDLPILNRVSQLSSRVSNNYVRLLKVMGAAGQELDEEGVYERGTPLLDELNEIEEELNSLPSDYPLDDLEQEKYRVLLDAFGVYRNDVITAVEMGTVNLEMAGFHIRGVARHYLAINQLFQELQRIFQEDIKREIGKQWEHSKQQLINYSMLLIITVAGMIVSGLLLARLMSADVQRMIKAMVELAKGNTGVQVPASVMASRELKTMGQALIVFRDSLIKLADSQERYQQLAQHDTLTGLPNRLLFHDRLNHALNRANRSKIGLALLFLDLDRFKQINDAFGHPMGDRLLALVAKDLLEALREEDTIARLGGDEFVVILEGVHGRDHVINVAEKLLAVIGRERSLDSLQMHIGVSIGISLYPEDGEDVTTLVRNADAAMYQAKAKGRNGYAFYTPMLTEVLEASFELERAMRQAVEQEQFLLLYQPQVDVESGEIVGVEALLRWQHPELGLMLPEQFISLAEESGLILPLGRWLVRQALQQVSQWQIDGLKPVRLSINISNHQLADVQFASELGELLGQFGLDPGLIELEVTENSCAENLEILIEHLESIKALGVQIAIDDFGTGYSSLSYLKQFPVDTLKVDRTFIHDLIGSMENQAIVRAMIVLGRSLGLQVISEGVEQSAELAWLRAEGCDTYQGFLHSQPMSAEAFAQLIMP
ncbi:diguanylate cyclase (GGDEF) domain [endosymbiont of Ridgeia piscesae]|jgi:diguanylate cyclase (GGDEF)-like protein|uniref:cyclic-guanylate-specific phosphodiesterase n=1 Tax=endosymbiont of Ridgeia piscesae TaxID=54398 RepID=A0A0T5YTA9_9GAMM|nr:EAL domain-containing protein [endosymbiont of Ridgeia piscesae]KRT53855.1 diguanylate cyclase (GGDEF) domain [endosymbiont of Ridgeia piscesae]